MAVAALIIPKNLGYAGIAGIPLQNGLYAAAAATILYAVFGTSRQISMGPSSGLAAVAASAVLAAGITSEADVATFVAGITLLSGLMFVLLAVLRMSWIARFLSQAVVTGFLFGAAIDVVVGELPKITGTDAEGSNAFQELWSWLGGLGSTDSATFVVGAVALVVVFGLRLVAPSVPGALVLLVGGLVVSVAADLEGRGVAVVGSIPSGLPAAEVPDVGLVWDHAGVASSAALALVLIGFSQTAGDAKVFATRHRYRVDLHQETIAQGVANAGAGLLQGMPVSTSLSASSLNDRAGARSGVASLTAGIVVIGTLLFLAPLFAHLPKPVLAALVIEAVVMGMMNVGEMRRLARVQRFDFWVAMVAILATLAVGVLAGVLVGIALSLLWLVAVATRPAMPTLGRRPGTTLFRPLSRHPGDEEFPGIEVLRLEGSLFFATSEALDERVRELIDGSDGGLDCIVLDCSAITFTDAQGAAALDELVTVAEESGLELRLARLRPAVRQVLDRDGVIEPHRRGPDPPERRPGGAGAPRRTRSRRYRTLPVGLLTLVTVT